MKTKSFKLIMSIVAILLAISGSFATQAREKKSQAIVPGYIHVPPTYLCMQATVCTNIVNPVLCTATYQGVLYQAFIKLHPEDTYCSGIGYRILE